MNCKRCGSSKVIVRSEGAPLCPRCALKHNRALREAAEAGAAAVERIFGVKPKVELMAELMVEATWR